MSNKDLPEINKFWDYSNPDETRNRFEKLESEHLDAPLDYRMQIKTQIARTYSLTGKFDEAHIVLDEVEPKLSENTPMARLRYLLERGRTFNSSGEKKVATELFMQAYSFGNSIEAYSYSVDAAHMVGLSSETFAAKLEWNQKGLQEAKKSTDPKVRAWVGVFHNNMGWGYFEIKKYNEALRQFERCRDFYQETETKDRLAIAKWSIAKAYRYLGRIDEALEIQEALLRDSGGEDKSGFTYEELAELYQLKEDTEKAKSFFAKAHETLSEDPWLQKHEADRLARLKKLSQ